MTRLGSRLGLRRIALKAELDAALALELPAAAEDADLPSELISIDSSTSSKNSLVSARD
jgi:hypothetical protein